MEPESDLFFAFNDVLRGKKALARSAHLCYKDFSEEKGYVVIEPHKKNTDSQR